MEELIPIMIEHSVKIFVYCPQCRKILYKLPVKEVTGVCRRVALKTVENHNGFLRHGAEIFIKEKLTNEAHKWTEENFCTLQFQREENRTGPFFVKNKDESKQNYEGNK